MSHSQSDKAAKDPENEEPADYQRILYSGQLFEVRPCKCKCTAPEIVPVGSPAPGTQALPAFPHRTTVQSVLNWGGTMVQSKVPGDNKYTTPPAPSIHKTTTPARTTQALTNPTGTNVTQTSLIEHQITRKRAELTRIRQQAEQLQHQVDSLWQYRQRISQDTAVTAQWNAAAQIQHLRVVEQQLTAQLGNIQQGSRRLRGKLRKLEADRCIKVGRSCITLTFLFLQSTIITPLVFLPSLLLDSTGIQPYSSSVLLVQQI